MYKKRKDAQWSSKDHGFVNDIKNGYKNHLSICQTWKRMAERTTNPKYQASQPTYKGTWVCEEWKLFSNFLNWCLENGHRKGLQLDKDIVDIGNKCYSPDTCVFVSGALNNLLAYKHSDNSGLPIGVYYREFNAEGYTKLKKPYGVQLKINGKQKHFGIYTTPEEAGLVYGREKSKIIIHKANNLTEEDCSLVHRKKIRLALKNHAKFLKEETENLYGGNTLY